MVKPIDMAKVDKMLQGFTIPPRPEMLKLLQEEIDRDEPDIKTISALISKDIGIAGFTLKVVNSPAIGLSRKVTTIEHACIFLGLKRIVMLVKSVALRFAVSGDNDDVCTQRLWNASSDVANCAAALAKHFNFAFSDEIFAVGMFHDAGIALILDQRDDYGEILRHGYEQKDVPLGEYEESQLESSHEVLGFLIAQTWGLDNQMSNVIGYHHNPAVMLATDDAIEKQMFATLKLAQHMVDSAGKLCRAATDNEWEKYGTQILDVLDLEDFQLLDIGEVLFEMGVDNIYHTH